MKNIQKLIAPALILFSCFFTSCDDNSSSNGSSNSATNLQPGQWTVVYFFDKKDETSDFGGYVFDFSSNGSLSASKNGQTWNGTWSTGLDDSHDKFYMDFTGILPSSLQELEEDWEIVKIEDNFMHFEHTSGGNGGTDIVHFKRN